MQTQQPENGTKLPADLQKDIEQARDNLIILQADNARLGGVKGGLERDIIKANNELVYTKGLSETQRKIKLNLQEDVAGLEKEKTKWEEDKTEREAEHQKMADLVEGDKIENDSTKKELEEKEKAVDERVIKIQGLEKSYQQREELIKIKEDKIKKLLKEL